MEKWLVLAALGALSIWMWIVGGRTRPAVRRAAAAGRVEPDARPGLRSSMRLGRCPRCGAWRVEGARCHDSRGYPRG